MASGVKVDPECIEAYNNFKLGKKEAFILFGFSNDNEKLRIVVLHKEPKTPIAANETALAKNAHWETLTKMLKNDDVCYAVADFNYNVADGQRSDIVFITWAPEKASIKKRMIVASSTEALKGILIGCKTSVQACCYPDLEMRNVAEKFKGTVD